MQPHSDPAEAARFLEDHPEIRDVDLLIADCNGVLRGKRLQRDSLAKVYVEGLCLPGSVFGGDIAGSTVEKTGLGQDTGDADCLCWPVPNTLKPVPWENGRGQVLLSMYDLEGRPFFADPRQVLRRVLEHTATRGLQPVVAVELEFYLCDGELGPDGRPLPPRSPRSGRRIGQTQVYSVADLEDQAALLDDIRAGCEAQKLPAFAAVAEYAPGQFEINLNHRPDPLSACDDAVQLKRLLKALARRHGLTATFMAKPYAHCSGSGMHIHVSLVNSDGCNVFSAPLDAPPTRLGHAIGGLLETMVESMPLWAPNVNSYRRFQADSFVPLGPNWGPNNRTVAVRIPAGPEGARRLEHRVAGADANPYLVMAAVLAGIHHGLEQEADPGKPVAGNAALHGPRSLPLTLPAALAALRAGSVVPAVIGEEFCAVYCASRAAEQQAFDRTITPLEYDWYLDSV